MTSRSTTTAGGRHGETTTRRPAVVVDVEANIEVLVLHGLTLAEDGDRIRDAIERALAGLFGEHAVLPLPIGDRHVDHLDGGMFEVAVGSTVSAEAIGVQVAHALHQEIAATSREPASP